MKFFLNYFKRGNYRIALMATINTNLFALVPRNCMEDPVYKFVNSINKSYLVEAVVRKAH